MVKNISIDNDENGHIIICLYGKKFVSTEPIKITSGRFMAKDIEKLVFIGQKSHDTIVFYPQKEN